MPNWCRPIAVISRDNLNQANNIYRWYIWSQWFLMKILLKQKCPLWHKAKTDEKATNELKYGVLLEIHRYSHMFKLLVFSAQCFTHPHVHAQCIRVHYSQVAQTGVPSQNCPILQCECILRQCTAALTKKGQSITKQHGWSQVVNEVQVWENAPFTVIFQKPKKTGGESRAVLNEQILLLHFYRSSHCKYILHGFKICCHEGIAFWNVQQPFGM